jgi:CheY-like chemotaxis protein
MRVLVVEDNAYRQNALKDLYRFHQAEIAETPNDALYMLKMKSFDIVHLDYDLDGKSTSEIVAHYLKKQSLNCIVIIHSENPDGTEKLQKILPISFALPISYFVSKNPFSNQMKSILASYEKESFSRIRKLLEENSNSNAV